MNDKDNNTKLVSIIIATFNGEKFIHEQMESIINQSYSNIEIIIVDDASVDKTLKIVYGYADKDSRITVYPSEKNIGLVKNFERGLEIASGELIALSDQDDIFYNNKIEMLVKRLEEESSCDLVVSDLCLIDEAGKIISESMWKEHKLSPVSGKPFHQLVVSNFATGCSMMFRRRLLILALPFPPNIMVHDWWIALISSSHQAGGICLINQPLVLYRQHDSNVIGAQSLLLFDYSTLKSLFQETIKLKSLIDKSRAKLPLDLARLEGYLKRHDFWNKKEKKLITGLFKIYSDMQRDYERSFFLRLCQIPKRVLFMMHTKSFRNCMKAIFLSLFIGTTKSENK